ncbi:hypothetical protein KN815_33305 [Streptomyces sp. 4503]|uniref:Secreted protein n=1 Tax=Streptomyces niphimycinicus TaxID=2842201 RepID=A0ABS6CP68_9ACTN|nr:hypothetical protein [Streptomyces niphimycinicus]MBU3868751.1 hypothetical protein [Streptomyces niphimycinicus]
MSHRTAVRHARKAAAAMLITIAAFGLTACQDGDTNSSSSSPSSSATQSPTSAAKPSQGSDQDSAKATPSGIPRKPGMRCTNQIDYGDDPRDNATINSIGSDTGYCPEPQKGGTPSGTPRKPGMRCTNQIDYGDDPRDNATINSIGSDTGYCPPVQHQ